ncbi:hypothetical protein [Nocardiopsis sp. YSL2]|uniref:hypothetical protein n=1 Tax=Nocardiopsis sp. YSL2 TaxID=2939492 RepID=UPI0026F45CDA|nr:hypothetical protein [Nocardiopsis sp. YSL2]
MIILRPILTLASATALTLISTSAGAGAFPAPQSQDLDVLGTGNGNEPRSSQLTAEVNEATRNESGNLLSVTWSITNNGNEDVVLSWFIDQSYAYTGRTFSAITATNTDGSIRYHPIMDDEGYCLCSGEYSAQLDVTASSGQTITYWSTFSVPSSLDSITVDIPEFDPIEDIPIS